MHRTRPQGGRPWPRATVAAVAVAAATLAGCSASGDGGTATTTTAGIRAQVIPIYRELTQCIRTHGYPDFPDPVVNDDGTVELPDDVERTLDQRKATLEPACQPILDRLPASVRNGGERVATPEQVAKLRQFAQCMRQHGLPDWPDPESDGGFPLSEELLREGKSPRILNGMHSCDQLNPDPNKRIRISSPEGGGKP